MRSTRNRSRARLIAPLALALVLGGSAAASGSAGRAPEAFRQVGHERLGRGLTHTELAGHHQRAHVARLDAASPLKLQPVLAGDAVAGTPALERTSAMCARVACLAAVNGDFFTLPGMPSGGVVADGEPVRSPSARRPQMFLDTDGLLDTAVLDFDAVLVSSDLRRWTLDGVNRERDASRSILYTARFGPSTRTPRGVTEVTLRFVDGETRLALDRTTAVRLVSIERGGDARIPRDGLVVAARGKDAERLRALWRAIRRGRTGSKALLRVSASRDALQSIGGRPVLIRDGRIVPDRDRSSFSDGRHPRTMIGRTADGDVLLVTVDGRQPGYSDGMTIAEAAAFMLALGATDAINLDGGGSTTFVVDGRVVNRPSDRAVRSGGRDAVVPTGAAGRLLGHVERPVANALAIVDGRRARRVVPRAIQARVTTSLVPRDGAAPPAPVAVDPASNPGADLPALVMIAHERADRDLLIAIAALAWAGSLWARRWTLGRARVGVS